MRRMKRTALMLGTALCLNACTDDALLPTTPADPQAQTGIMTRATGDCAIGNGQQKMHFTQTDGGYTTQLLCYGQSYAPRQGAMVMLQVWAAGLSSSTLCTTPDMAAQTTSPSGARMSTPSWVRQSRSVTS